MRSKDKEHRAWIQTQPSCISGKFSEYVNGEGRNPACHVRRSKRSGTGYKALYACIPLTHEEHAIQHQKGELALLRRAFPRQLWTVETAKEWFDNQVIKYFKMWGGA